MEEVSGAYNKKYFDRWSNLLRNSFFKSYYRYIARKYEPAFAKYGYSLTKGLDIDEEVLRGGTIAAAVGALCCLGADAGAFLRRFGTWSRWFIKRLIKAFLPEFVLTRIRQARCSRGAVRREQDAYQKSDTSPPEVDQLTEG